MQYAEQIEIIAAELLKELFGCDYAEFRVGSGWLATCMRICGIELPLPPVAGDFNALRLGSQEVTRWGIAPGDMPQIAELIARVLVRGEAPARVRPDVVALRRGFQELHFVR